MVLRDSFLQAAIAEQVVPLLVFAPQSRLIGKGLRNNSQVTGFSGFSAACERAPIFQALQSQDSQETSDVFYNQPSLLDL